MIIDAHVHISKLQQGPFAADSFEKSRDLLLADMKSSSVDHALVIAGFSDTNENLNPSTKTLIDLVLGEQQLSVIGSVDIPNAQQSHFDQLDQWLTQKKIVGVKIYLGYQHVYPYDKTCYPVYELCQKYDVPVVFHTGDTFSTYVKNAKLKYSHPFNLDEVAVDFPNLKIVIAHMGNPWLVDCAELLYKHENVFADVSGLVAGGPIEKGYGDLMRQRIKDLIAYSSANKLIYGTDWPLAPMPDYLGFVQSLGVAEVSQDRMMYKNALELFNLNV